MKASRKSACLEAIKLHPDDLDNLTEALEDYQRTGFDADEALAKAVADVEWTLEDERRQLTSAMREQKPELFDDSPVLFRSSTDGQPGSMSADQVQKAVEDALQDMGSPTVEVVSSSEFFGGQPPVSGVPKGGTMPDGRVVVFHDQALSPIDVARTVFHELFHRGIKSTFDNNAAYVQALLGLRKNSDLVDRWARQWKSSPDGTTKLAEFRAKGPMEGERLASYEALAAEEALARQAERLMSGEFRESRGPLKRLALTFAKLADFMGLKQLGDYLRNAGQTEAERFIREVVGRSANPLTFHGVQTTNYRTGLSQPAFDRAMSAVGSMAGAKSKLGQMLQDAMLNLKESKLLLRFMTNDQIEETFEMPALAKMMSALGRMGSAANRSMERAAEVTKIWRALGEDMGVKVSDMMLKSTLAKAHVDLKDKNGRYLTAREAFDHIDNAHIKLADSPQEFEKYRKLHAEFMALPPEAKRVYEMVRQDLQTQRDEQRAAFFRQAAELYGPALRRGGLSDEELELIADGSDELKDLVKKLTGTVGTPAERKALAGLRDTLREVNAAFRDARGPYFPLVRFGDHVVVVKSAKVSEVEAQLNAIKVDLQKAVDELESTPDAEVDNQAERVATLRKTYADARARLAKLKESDSNYSVRFYETPAQAEQERRALQAQNPEARVYRTRREEYLRGVSGAAPAFIRNLEEVISSALDAGGQVDPAAKAEALKAMRDLWLRQSPERSALRSELSRRGVDGVNVNQMLAGYAQHSRSNSWRTSRLAFQSDLNASLLELGQQRDDPNSVLVLNEMKRRVMSDLRPPEDSKVLQTASNMTYFWQLGMNASYFITNATQSWLTSLPFMGGRHGYNTARRELLTASKTVIALLKGASAESIKKNGVVVGLQLRMTDDLLRKAARSEREYQMLKELTEDGVVDITAKHDLGMVADGTRRIPVVSEVFELSGILANYPELYNRLSTALAAYRLEERRAGDDKVDAAKIHAQAVQYARNVLNRTHFNYSQENAPSIMRGPVARLMFQFKRYQQGMIYLYAKLVNDAFIKPLEGPDAKQRQAEARKALFYTLGSTLATSGLAGLPIAAPVAFLASIAAALSPDDDEPDYMLTGYNGIKDVLGETGGQMLGKGLGAAFGLDLSGKLGQGSILNPVAFADTEGKDKLSKDYWTAMAIAALGPTFSTFTNIMDGLGQMAEGNVQKGFERMTPVAIANVSKAARIAGEGEVSRSGDVLLSPDEFNALDVGLKALGFQNVETSDMYDQRVSYNNRVRALKDERNRLLRLAASGDDMTDEIAEFNARNPAFPITGKTLANYRKERAEAASQMRGGMRVGARDADVLDQLGQ